jgi:hypothetical protein
MVIQTRIASNAATLFQKYRVPVGLYHGPGVRHELVRDRDYVDDWPRVREAWALPCA